jgi:hypothetical protein
MRLIGRAPAAGSGATRGHYRRIDAVLLAFGFKLLGDAIAVLF